MLDPLHPAAWVLDHLQDQGWDILDLLAFTRASTLVKATRGGHETVVVKAGFGSNHVLARLDEAARPAAYGFYWYAQLTDDELALARQDFVDETDLTQRASALNHVTPLLERGGCAAFDWYTMPYCADGNFRPLLQRPGGPTAEGLGILADVADGLNHLHQYGIVHRDVYQENVLIDDGRGQITDLGAARRIDEPRGPRSRSPEVHWPPEYATDYAHATPAADVYSLAVLAYRYLTGDIPRLSPSPGGRGALPDGSLGHAIRAGLSHHPAARPPMPELRDALRDASTARET
jgi:serine/threonine protein kinase